MLTRPTAILRSIASHRTACCAAVALCLPSFAPAQSTAPGTQSAGPIAIVPLQQGKSSTGATVTGALQVTADKAIIAVSGAVTAGPTTTDVLLPQRGTLRVCASTTVKLAADSSAPAGNPPGLMMAMDHGAIEASFATGRSADILLTPDFRILISGPGAAEVKVRLGEHGDTCVENGGPNAPYVLVTSVFDGGNYHVQPGQRVMFQHGSVHEVVDQEKEPCGCPPATPAPQSNDFPLAQSEGLSPTPKPSPSHATSPANTSPPMVFNARPLALQPAASPAPLAPAPAPQPRKRGVMHRIGHFFHRLFGGK
jgi:hypothetical protein